MAIGGGGLQNRYELSDGGRGGSRTNFTPSVAGAVAGAVTALQGAGSSGSASSSGRSSGSGRTTPSVNSQALLDAYRNALAGQSGAFLAEYDDAFARSAQRIEDAFNSSMGRVAEGYNNAAGAYGQNLNSALGVINDSYNASHGEVTTDAERSLREAYINNMMRRRDLNQTLSAMGLNGGASESTMASLSNQYGNARTDIEETKAKNLADLLRLRDQNVASAQQEYNTRLADLYNQRLNMENSLIANRLSALNQADQASAAARAQIAMFNLQQMNNYQNNLQNAMARLASGGNVDLSAFSAAPVFGGLQAIGDSAMTGLNNIGLTGWNVGNYNANTAAYANELQRLMDAQRGYALTASQAGNAYNPASVQQVQTATGTNYAKYIQQLQQQLASGANPNDVRTAVYQQVQNGNVARDDLASMLRQLGLI